MQQKKTAHTSGLKSILFPCKKETAVYATTVSILQIYTKNVDYILQIYTKNVD